MCICKLKLPDFFLFNRNFAFHNAIGKRSDYSNFSLLKLFNSNRVREFGSS
jgi:hypothetical protein